MKRDQSPDFTGCVGVWVCGNPYTTPTAIVDHMCKHMQPSWPSWHWFGPTLSPLVLAVLEINHNGPQFQGNKSTCISFLSSNGACFLVDGENILVLQ
jgi:hypothetical protein